MVMEVVHEDMGEGNMQCTKHLYKNSTAGGICVFCLQEKLGKLVSSSFPVAVFPSSSSSSSSPSFRSDFNGSSASSSVVSQGNYNGYCTRKSRLPFVLTQKKKQKKEESGLVMGGSNSNSSTSIVFKRSKSTATPSRRGMHFLDEKDYNTPHTHSGHRGFWSFLYMSKHPKKSDKNLNFTPSTNVGPSSSREKTREDFVIVDENGSPDVQFDRKVSRSRSVGCGSRSFSGDFFDRISTGFGDCTLRRVESQREGKPKVQPSRVRCGGIFSGFMITSSSSSSSSSSYWVSNDGGGVKAARPKTWGWALASPMRAFGKPSSVKRDSGKNVTPNLAAIPSLLAV